MTKKPHIFKQTKFSRLLRNVVKQAKIVASAYYEENGRPLGITGEVADFEAIRILKLQQSDPRQKGYDAWMKTPKGTEKVQIKGKVIQPGKNNGQRMGAIKKNSEWDSVILVIFDQKFKVSEIYKAPKRKINKVLEKEGSVARNVRGSLSISKFKSISTLIWPKS